MNQGGIGDISPKILPGCARDACRDLADGIFETVGVNVESEVVLSEGNSAPFLKYRKEALQNVRLQVDAIAEVWRSLEAELRPLQIELQRVTTKLFQEDQGKECRSGCKGRGNRGLASDERVVGYETRVSSRATMTADHIRSSLKPHATESVSQGVVWAGASANMEWDDISELVSADSTGLSVTVEDLSDGWEGDSEDDEETFQHAVLQVQGEPDFESGPPEDGWEYLRRVRYERDHCPKVVVASIDLRALPDNRTPYLPQSVEIPTCSVDLLSSVEWERTFLRGFSELRMAMADMGWQPGESGDSVESLPKMHDTAAWHYLCFGTKLNVEGGTEAASATQIADDVTARAQTQGILRASENVSDKEDILVAPDTRDQSSPHIDSLMVHSDHLSGGQAAHVSSLEGAGTKWGVALLPQLRLLRRLDEVSRALLLRQHICWMTDLKQLARDRACWLFALAVVVDRPLDANTSSALATLFRKCSELKSRVTAREELALPMLDILLSIAGSYFGQRATSIG